LKNKYSNWYHEVGGCKSEEYSRAKAISGECTLREDNVGAGPEVEIGVEGSASVIEVELSVAARLRDILSLLLSVSRVPRLGVFPSRCFPICSSYS